jgi:hypothetical protein
VAVRREAGGDPLQTDTEEIAAGVPVVFTARVAAREGAGWGALAIDFGDGEATRVPNLFGHADVSHVYQKPGRHLIVATFASAQGTLLHRELTVSVHPPAVPAR